MRRFLSESDAAELAALAARRVVRALEQAGVGAGRLEPEILREISLAACPPVPGLEPVATPEVEVTERIAHKGTEHLRGTSRHARPKDVRAFLGRTEPGREIGAMWMGGGGEWGASLFPGKP